MRYVIINADDFGYSTSINKGIIEGCRKKCISSTSIMVHGSATDDATLLKALPDVSVGLHLHIEKSTEDIQAEFDSQLSMFLALVGHQPDHIDVHKPRSSNLHAILPVLQSYSDTNKIPVRELGHATSVKDFFGLNVHGDGLYDARRITEANLLTILSTLKEGVSEIMCHAGYSSDELRRMSSYSDAREAELKSLSSPRVLEYLHNTPGLQLVSWKTVPLQW